MTSSVVRYVELSLIQTIQTFGNCGRYSQDICTTYVGVQNVKVIIVKFALTVAFFVFKFNDRLLIPFTIHSETGSTCLEHFLRP